MHSSHKLLKGRHSLPNYYYAITLCSASRVPLFYNFNVACIVARAILAIHKKGEINSICYTLMPDHLHWLFQINNVTLSEVMRQYKSQTTIGINKYNNSRGVIWQKGYYDHRIRDETDLINQARYIVANPLRAKLVRSVKDYPFWDCIYLTP